MTQHKTIRYGLDSETGASPKSAHADSVFAYDDSGAAFTDYTAAADDSTTIDVLPLGDLSDILYIGATDLFGALRVVLTVNGSGARAVEYWDGAAWATLTITFQAGTAAFVGSMRATWAIPSDWATTTVNGVSQYWIRFRVTSAGTAPQLTSIQIGRVVEWSQTIYIPESTTRVFESVAVWIWNRAAYGASFYWGYLQIKVGSGSWVQVNHDGTTIVQTGEALPLTAAFDVTSAFTSDFSGTSQTVVVRFMALASAAAAAPPVETTLSGGQVIITYTAEDQNTRIKTVCIPFQSNTANLTTTLATVDTVPNLSTFIPEASVTFRDIHFEIRGNNASQNSTDKTLVLALDAEGGDTYTFIDPNTSPNMVHLIWSRNDMTTNATHDLKASVGNAAASPMLVVVWLWVTYEYNHSSSTTILNSLMIPFGQYRGILPTDSAEPAKFTQVVSIQEPATITIKKSAVMLLFDAAVEDSAMALLLDANNASYTSYNIRGEASGGGGNYCCQHPVDSEWSLSRGFNTLDFYATASVSTEHFGGTSLVAILNYTSGKHANGDQVHNKTIVNLFGYATGYTSVMEFGSKTLFTSPPTYYWVDSWGLWDIFVSANGPLAASMHAQQSGNEFDIYSFWGTGVAEVSSVEKFVTGKPEFKRFPGEADNVRIMSLTTAIDNVRTMTDASSADIHFSLITYHQISFTFSGNLNGYTGDGSGVTIDIFRSDTDEKVGEATTAIGGGYTFTWYDNTVSLYGSARQDGTHVGRSESAVAT
jgi:hypothetical protein